MDLVAIISAFLFRLLIVRSFTLSDCIAEKLDTELWDDGYIIW
jgi:hypothetical protein